MIFTLVLASAVATTPARITAEVRRTVERFDEVAALEHSEKWDDALARYSQLMEECPNDLIPARAGSAVWRSAGNVALDRIAQQSELQKRFAARWEMSARTSLDAAKPRKDMAGLRRIVDQLSPTNAANTARDMLGELAFERGEFAQARHEWSCCKANADVHAKIIIASAFLGETIDHELENFRKQYPNAQGRIAGRAGNLADLIAGIQPKPSVSIDAFLALKATRLLPMIPLTESAAEMTDRIVQRPTISPQELHIHPIIFDQHIVICDGATIAAFDARSGKRVDAIMENDAVAAPIPSKPVVAGNKIVARLNGDIVCLTRQADAREFRWKLLWRLSAKTLPDGSAEFGDPLVDGDKLFVTWIRPAANRQTISVGRFSVDSPAKPIWHRAVAELIADFDSKAIPPVLAIAGPHLVISTNAGAIVALDREAGRPIWAFHYEALGPRSMSHDFLPIPRAVVEPLAVDGRLFIAPADTHQVFALDQWTGEPLWERAPHLEAVQLVGVIREKLIVPADGLLRGIGAIDVKTGKIDPAWGSLTSVPPLGNCVIIGEHVLFPTKHDGLKVLRPDGQLVYPATVFHPLPGGNLAFGDGLLVVAEADRLQRISFNDK